MSEQPNPAPKVPTITPAAELEAAFSVEAVFSGVDSLDAQIPASIEEFRDKEPFTARARRVGKRAVYGKNRHMSRSDGSVVSTVKPARYNVDGYVENVANAIDGLIAETGEFPEALYDVAETAAATINQEERDYRYFSDDPQGAEAIGILKAITSRPAFIKSSRAEEVLSQLGQASHRICGENMFTKSNHPWPSTMKKGYDASSIQDFQRIATSDVLWDKSKDRDTVWPLTSVATALQTLAVVHPDATQEARLAVLKKNEVSGSLPEVDFHLVYSFSSDEDKAFLADAAEQETWQGTGSRVAQNILDGYYDNVMWAI